MTEAELEKLKHTGVIGALFDGVKTRLWTIKMASEEAGKNGLSNFPQEIEKLQEALDEAMTIYHEWFRLSKTKGPSDNG